MGVVLKASKILFPIYIITFSLFVSSSGIVKADQVYHSEKYGYSFTIPEKWQQFSEEDFSEFLDLVLHRENAPCIFEAAFQFPKPGIWFGYPYMYIRVFEYEDMGFEKQPNKQEIKKYFNELLRVNLGESARKHLKGGAKEMLEASQLGEVLYDSPKKLFVYNISTKGSIAQTIVFFGKNHCIQMLFCDFASNWENTQTDRDLIINTFKFDIGNEYDESINKFPLFRYLIYTLIGLIIITLIVLVIIQEKKS